MEKGKYGQKTDPNAAGEHCDKNEVHSISSEKTWSSFTQLRDFWSNTERSGSSFNRGCKSLAFVAPVPEERHKDNSQSNDANVSRHVSDNKKYFSEGGDLVTGRKDSSLKPQLQYDNAHSDETSNSDSRRKHHTIQRQHTDEEMKHSKSVMRDIHPDMTRPMKASHGPTYANTRKHSDSIEYASSKKESAGGRRNSMGEPKNYFVHEENGSVYKDIALDDARNMNDRYSHGTRNSIPQGRKSAIDSQRERASENKTKGSSRGYPPSTTGSERNSRLRSSYDGSNQRHPRIFQRTEHSTRSSIQGDELNSRAPAYSKSFSHETQRSSGNARDLELDAPMANEGKASRQERSIVYEEGSRIPPEALRNVSDFYDNVEDERGRITQEPATMSGFPRKSFRGDMRSKCGCDNWCPVREDELIYEEAIDPRSTARSRKRDGSDLRSYALQAREVEGRKRSTLRERTLDQTFERGSQKVYREPISTEEQIYHDSKFQDSFPQNSAINERRPTPFPHESHRGLRPSRWSNNNESVEQRRTLIKRMLDSNGEVIFEERYDDPSMDYTLERRQTQPETFRMVSFSEKDRDRRETQRAADMESEPDGDMVERSTGSSIVQPRSREQSLKYSRSTVRAPGEGGSLHLARGGTELLDEYITQQRRSTLAERRVTADLQRQPGVSHLIEAGKSYNEFRDVSAEMADGVKRGTYDEQRSIPGSQRSSAEQEDGVRSLKRSKLVLKQGAPKLASKRDESAQKSLSIERESLGTEEPVIPRTSRRISDNSYYAERPVYRDEEVDLVGDTHGDSRGSVISSDRGSLHDRSLSEVSETVYEDILPMDKGEHTKHLLHPNCQCGCQDLVQRVHSQRTERSTHSGIPVAGLSKSRPDPEELRDGEGRATYGDRNSMLQSQKRISHTDDYNYDYAYGDDEGGNYENYDDEEDAFEEGSNKSLVSERQSEYMPPKEIVYRSSIDQDLLESTGATREIPPIYEELKDAERHTGSSQRASGDYERYSPRGSDLKYQRRYTSDGRTSDLKFQRESQMKNYDTVNRVRQKVDDSQYLNEIRRIPPYQDAIAGDRKSRYLGSDSNERQHLRTDGEADLRSHSRRITEHSYAEPDRISRRESHKAYDEPPVFRKTNGDLESINEIHRISVQPVGGIGQRATFFGGGGRGNTSQASEFESPTSTIHERKLERTTERESQKIYTGSGNFRRQTVGNSKSLTEGRMSRQKPESMEDKMTHTGTDDKELENVSPSIIHERISGRATGNERQEIHEEPGIFKRQTTDNVQTVNEVHRVSKMKAGSMDRRDAADDRKYTFQGSTIEHPRSILRERTSGRRTEKVSQKIYDEPRAFKRQTVDDSESLNEYHEISRQEAGSMNKRRTTLTGSGDRNASYNGQLEYPVSSSPEKEENRQAYDKQASFKRRNNEDSEYPNEVRRIPRQQARSVEERRSAPDGPDVRRYANRPSEMENPRRTLIRGRTWERRTEEEHQKIHEEPGSYRSERVNDPESQNKIQRHSRQQAGYTENGKSAVINPVFRRSQGGVRQ